jgi:hypothetical protein
MISGLVVKEVKERTGYQALKKENRKWDDHKVHRACVSFDLALLSFDITQETAAFGSRRPSTT